MSYISRLSRQENYERFLQIYEDTYRIIPEFSLFSPQYVSDNHEDNDFVTIETRQVDVMQESRARVGEISSSRSNESTEESPRLVSKYKSNFEQLCDCKDIMFPILFKGDSETTFESVLKWRLVSKTFTEITNRTVNAFLPLSGSININFSQLNQRLSQILSVVRVGIFPMWIMQLKPEEVELGYEMIDFMNDFSVQKKQRLMDEVNDVDEKIADQSLLDIDPTIFAQTTLLLDLPRIQKYVTAFKSNFKIALSFFIKDLMYETIYLEEKLNQHSSKIGNICLKIDDEDDLPELIDLVSGDDFNLEKSQKRQILRKTNELDLCEFDFYGSRPAAHFALILKFIRDAECCLHGIEALKCGDITDPMFSFENLNIRRLSFQNICSIHQKPLTLENLPYLEMLSFGNLSRVIKDEYGVMVIDPRCCVQISMLPRLKKLKFGDLDVTTKISPLPQLEKLEFGNIKCGLHLTNFPELRILMFGNVNTLLLMPILPKLKILKFDNIGMYRHGRILSAVFSLYLYSAPELEKLSFGNIQNYIQNDIQDANPEFETYIRGLTFNNFPKLEELKFGNIDTPLVLPSFGQLITKQFGNINADLKIEDSPRLSKLKFGDVNTPLTLPSFEELVTMEFGNINADLTIEDCPQLSSLKFESINATVTLANDRLLTLFNENKTNETITSSSGNSRIVKPKGGCIIT